MIREAKREDVERLSAMVSSVMVSREWASISNCQPHIESIKLLIQYHIRDSNGCAFVNETDGEIDGAFLGCVMPWLLDLKYVAAHEKISFGQNLDGLWEVFLQWARSKNAITCVRGCYDAFEGPRLRRIN